MGRFILILSIFFLFQFEASSAQYIFSLDGQWKAEKASHVILNGNELTKSNMKLNTNSNTNSNTKLTENWMNATVPGTVLSLLWENDLVKNPYEMLNNQDIADIYITGREEYTYWFYKEFKTPKLKGDERLWLSFRGINYLADIYLNGHKVNTPVHEGMFLREKYDITSYVNKNGHNKLAVLVQPVLIPGNAEVGQAGDGEIARNVSRQFTAGWDWNSNIPDRNTGIWDHVNLKVTGLVDIGNSYIWSRVPGKRFPQSKSQASAYLNPSIELVNSADSTQVIKLIFNYSFSNKLLQKIEKIVELLPYETKEVNLEELEVKNPHLWWPNGTGDQPLYSANFTVVNDHNVIKTQEEFKFGIRDTKSYFDTDIGGRVFTVNGQKIFIKGGNWIGSDALLQLSADRYDSEVRFHAEANMNMIRVWGGSMTERPEFYEACDKYGIMVWQDLWITGDGNGEWADPTKKQPQEIRKQYPDNHDLFTSSVKDQVKMLRNHPSLYLWCGGNETTPPQDINEKLQYEVFPALDPSRDYLEKSTGPQISSDKNTSEIDGPYGWQSPIFFYKTDWLPFNPEIGSVGIPNIENLKKIIGGDLLPPTNNNLSSSPENNVWDYHKYIDFGDAINAYGDIHNLEDFVKTAQVVSYQQYQALQEGHTSRMWTYYSGALVWKTQNPWTALRGMFYDYYLDPVGGLYGYKHAADPIHAQYDLSDKMISVVNQTLDAQNIDLDVTTYGLHGSQLEKKSQRLIVEANSITKLFLAPQDTSHEKPIFMRLLAKDKNNKIHKNFYWLGDGSGTDFQHLSKLQEATLKIFSKRGSQKKLKITVNNSGKETAFFIRLKVINKKTKEIVLPVFYSDNYITLFPGESEVIDLDMSKLKNVLPSDLSVVAQAWNGERKFTL